MADPRAVRAGHDDLDQLRVERDWLLAEADDDTRARFFAARRDEAAQKPTAAPAHPVTPAVPRQDGSGHEGPAAGGVQDIPDELVSRIMKAAEERMGDPCEHLLCWTRVIVEEAYPYLVAPALRSLVVEFDAQAERCEEQVGVEARAVRDVVNAAEGPRMVSTKGCRRMLDAIRAAFPAGDFVATDEEHQRAVAVAAGYSNAGPTARKYARLIMAAVSAAAGVSPAQGGDHGA